MPTIRAKNVDRFFRACGIVCLVGVVIIVGCLILVTSSFNTPKADYTTMPLSLSDFYSRSGEEGGLPATATNLYYANSVVGFTGFVKIYRFDAPVADCVAYGKKLLKTGDANDTKLTVLSSPPDPIGRGSLDHMGLAKVDWLDVETIRSGFTGHRDATKSGQPSMTFWIDADRGRFYFYSSD